MIRSVEGEILSRGKNHLVVAVGGAGGGIGLRIFCPEPTLASVHSGDSILLHTYLQVRESELSLYGFANEDELDLFEMLLGVSGVGPKVALAALSTLTPDAFRLAVANGEPAIVARTPGIGKRTAEKIVVELKGKLGAGEGTLEELASTIDADSEVIEALTGLGYSIVEAQRLVQQIPDDVSGVEERLRVALSRLGE